MLMRSRRIQWNGCRVHDAASGLWSGSSITGEPRRAGAGQTVIVIGACKITLSNIGYHEICSVFKCDIGSKEIELEVIKSGNYSCDGCIFNNNIYCCRDTYCIDRDREDNTDVIYKEVKRS